jgi:hypothetical protein
MKTNYNIVVSSQIGKHLFNYMQLNSPYAKNQLVETFPAYTRSEYLPLDDILNHLNIVHNSYSIFQRSILVLPSYLHSSLPNVVPWRFYGHHFAHVSMLLHWCYRTTYYIILLRLSTSSTIINYVYLYVYSPTKMISWRTLVNRCDSHPVLQDEVILESFSEYSSRHETK